MTKLNKIAKVLILSGISSWVTIAQAADVQINQSTQINQQIKVSQEIEPSDNSAQVSSQSDNSVESDTQVNANTADDNSPGSTPSEPVGEQVSNGSNADPSQTFNNNNQLITILSSNAEKSINITSGAQATLGNSLTQVTSKEFNVFSENDLPEGNESVPNEDLAESEDVFLNPEVDSAASLINTSQVSQQISGDFQNNGALNVAAKTTQALEQIINASVVNAITTNTQSAITETVNSQINSVITEQVNAELASATAAEVVSTLANDLDIGL